MANLFPSLNLSHSFRALRHPNFRLFFWGQLVSVIGVWMQITAQQWLVYRITGSQTSLGLVTFINFLPVLLLSLFMGVIVDQFPRRKLLLFTTSWFMLLAGLLALLTWLEIIQYWHILLLAFLLGIGNALDMPARQAFVVELVDDDKNDVMNAIGLNSTLFNIARIIGPAIGGVIVATLGEAPAFAINGLSYLAVIFVLLLMKFSLPVITSSRSNPLEKMKDGFRYIFGEKAILGLVVMVAAFSMVGFIGGLLLVIYGDHFQKGKTLIFSRLLLGPGIIGLALSRTPWVSMAFMGLIGFSFITQFVFSNTLIQTIVPDELRGRVLSTFTWALGGFYPLGSLVMGFLGDQIGAPSAALLSGIGCILLVLFNLAVFPSMQKLT